MNPSATRLPILALIIVTILWLAPARGDDEIIVAIEPWAPFADEDLPGRGFLTRLTEAAFEAAGYEPRVEFIPWARALHDVEQGYRHVLMGLFYSEEREQVYRYSEPVYQAQVGLVARADFERDAYDSLQELVEYTIGIGRGFANSPEFDAAAEDYLNVDIATDHATHIPMLFAERIDMMAGTVDIILHAAEQQGHPAASMKVLEPPLMVHDIHIGVSRAIDDSERIRDDFNRGLRAIRADGTYDDIMARYGPGA